MEIGEIRVIDEREQGSMGGGCWKEFLVLEKLNTTEYLLNIRRWDYIYIGELYDLGLKEDENGELIVPDEINGILVQEINDGFVLGGEELVKSENEEGEVKFTLLDQSEIIRWLKTTKWIIEEVEEKIQDAITRESVW